jgi:hypothetical protein
MSVTDPATGDFGAGLPHMCLMIEDTCKPDCGVEFIIAAMEISLSIRYVDASFD